MSVVHARNLDVYIEGVKISHLVQDMTIRAEVGSVVQTTLTLMAEVHWDARTKTVHIGKRLASKDPDPVIRGMSLSGIPTGG